MKSETFFGILRKSCSVNGKLLLLLATLFIGTELFADTEEKDFFEHRTKQYLVRVSSGPNEYASLGSYAVQVYDSEGIRLISGVVSERDGEIVKTWVIPERLGKRGISILVWTRCAGSGSYGRLDRFEFDGKRLRNAKLPELDDHTLLEGYMGHDHFDVENGIIYREFPVYLPDDCNAIPTGGKRCLELQIRKKTWQLSAKSTAKPEIEK